MGCVASLPSLLSRTSTLNWNIKSKQCYISKRGFISWDICHRNWRAPMWGADFSQPENSSGAGQGSWIPTEPPSLLHTHPLASTVIPLTAKTAPWSTLSQNTLSPLGTLSVAWSFLRPKRLLLLWLFFPQSPSNTLFLCSHLLFYNWCPPP